MLHAGLRTCRSLLYLPASNPRAIAKARSLAADMVILDCEDSVKPEEKAAARTAAVAAAGERFGSCLVAIRVNAAGTEWHLEDLAAARNSAADCIILPKVETGDAAAAAASHLGIPVVAMIETPAGVLNARTIAGTSAALLAGTNDLAASLGIASSAGRTGLACSLQMVVLAARAAGIAVFDGVYNRLDDDEGFATECREGRAFGFDGKSLIHPGQIEIANRIFSPGPDEIAEAERLVAAARGGAERFEGRMIETLHVVEAEAVLAKSRR